MTGYFRGTGLFYVLRHIAARILNRTKKNRKSFSNNQTLFIFAAFLSIISEHYPKLASVGCIFGRIDEEGE
jgi:hypothetical protein